MFLCESTYVSMWCFSAGGPQHRPIGWEDLCGDVREIILSKLSLRPLARAAVLCKEMKKAYAARVAQEQAILLSAGRASYGESLFSELVTVLQRPLCGHLPPATLWSNRDDDDDDDGDASTQVDGDDASAQAIKNTATPSANSWVYAKNLYHNWAPPVGWCATIFKPDMPKNIFEAVLVSRVRGGRNFPLRFYVDEIDGNNVQGNRFCARGGVCGSSGSSAGHLPAVP
jgi:hypothetical protein